VTDGSGKENGSAGQFCSLSHSSLSSFGAAEEMMLLVNRDLQTPAVCLGSLQVLSSLKTVTFTHCLRLALLDWGEEMSKAREDAIVLQKKTEYLR
jgi:hypothetical protein